jgi:precorrin-6B methylase 2
MLDLANVTAQDEVIDLGSGDGRTVIAAAKRGARARGIEYNPEMVELSIANAKAEGVSDKATFVKADLFETDLSKATVITMFLLTDINLRLRPTLLTLKPGTRLVSNTFTMGEWEADATASAGEDCTSWCTALLWIVPARVEGTWTLTDLSTLTLSQSFQMVSGTLAKGTGTTAIEGGRLRGDEIRFTIGTSEYTGRVTGDSMVGTAKTGDKATHWSATRKTQ